METLYENPFFILAGLHALVLVSPGANFAILVQNTLTHGKRIGFCIAIGVAMGTAFYVFCALFGIKLLLAIASSRWLFTALKLVGAAYLAYLGVRTLLARHARMLDSSLEVGHMSRSEAVRIGLFSQLSNPKAVLFFLGLFTQVIDFHTPFLIKLGYGAWMCVATLCWFAFVVWLLSFLNVRERLREWLYWIGKAFGAMLIFLAVVLALYS